MTDHPQPVLEVAHVSKRFGDVAALTDVTLTAGAGEVVGLLGPNGAGKTTLVRIVATLLRPDAGAVTVGGRDAGAEAEEVRKLIGLAGQFAALDELLTGRENLELIGSLYGLDRATASERADGLLRRFGLLDAAERRVGSYSGGMRRRLDLGATLIGRPALLLLDEPTAGLDPRTRGDLWDAVDELASSGTTVLLTSQYLEEIDRLATRVVVLDRGRILAEGSSADLKRRTGGHVIEARVSDPADVDEARRALVTVGGERMVARTSSDRVAVPCSGSTDDLLVAVRELEHAHVDVSELALRLPLLDDVFLALTGAPATAPSEPADDEDVASDGEARSPAAPLESVAQSREPSGSHTWSDIATVTGRDLKRLARTPQLLFFAVVQPVLFVLGLSAVFEGLVESVLGGNYIDYLLPGVLVMNVMLAAGSTGVGLAQDMQAGVIDRFRSLPMSRTAVLAGRTLSDLIRNAAAMVLMVGAGFLLGYRIGGSVVYALAAFAMSLFFGYACTWMFAAVGIAVRDPQAAQFAGFAPVLPLVYLSSAWVPIETMNGAVRSFATYQPVNVVIDAVRSLARGAPDWPSVWGGVAWSTAILVAFVVIATRQYSRTTR